MALLTLKDIGKIYVSDGNVAVGIRGVNLSFDRGEFVAITGKSGSGKSTLLNVISGMDSYEEGELYIEGETTSHFLQPEWEEYRQKYISFIFQDYNIIESFTVLQNVELALMHIDDKRERRKRAMELIRRVGLADHIKHKGSKLSGGQKQRTVIARALAKDSPIILADEPTGNLDSATSAEIIQLLREVSRDKLLIMVTHNFDQVEHCATRHIRVFDGAIESDRILQTPTSVIEEKEDIPLQKKPVVHKKSSSVKNGLTLGRAIFTAKPKLSLFLCLLMIIGALGIFAVTSLVGLSFEDFNNNMFNPIEGRVVLTTQDGSVLSEDQVKALASEYGAKEYLTCDLLLDTGTSNAYMGTPMATVPLNGRPGDFRRMQFAYTYNESFGDDILGRYPTAPNEVLLSLPLFEAVDFGRDEILIDTILFSDLELKVVGIHYYYDNTIEPRCLFTKDGFEIMTAVHYLLERAENVRVSVNTPNQSGGTMISSDPYSSPFLPSFEIEDGKIYVEEYEKAMAKNPIEAQKITASFSAEYYQYSDYGARSSQFQFSENFTADQMTAVKPSVPAALSMRQSYTRVISVSLLKDMADDVLSKSYKQVSLFFPDDATADAAAEALNAAGYIAVPADATYTPGADEIMTLMLLTVIMGLVWLLAIVFLAFFIHLCSSRTLAAFKSDMAIMRSMGIPSRVIRIGMYVRMLIALIPAYIIVVLSAILIFTTPALNGIFVYLELWQYALIFLGVLLLTLRITHKQVRKLFGESVKKSLKGGSAE